MEKVKVAVAAIVAGYERAIDFITKHPRVTFWLIVAVVVAVVVLGILF